MNHKFRETKSYVTTRTSLWYDFSVSCGHWLFMKFVPKICEKCRLTGYWKAHIPTGNDRAAAAFLSSTDWEGRTERWQQSRSYNILSAEATLSPHALLGAFIEQLRGTFALAASCLLQSYLAWYPQYTGKIAWCSCIGEKTGEEVKRRDMMTEKEMATENISTGRVNTKENYYWTDSFQGSIAK